MHRRLVYIYLLNVPSFSSRYFNKIKLMSRLGRWHALSLEILCCLKHISLACELSRVSSIFAVHKVLKSCIKEHSDRVVEW